MSSKLNTLYTIPQSLSLIHRVIFSVNNKFEMEEEKKTKKRSDAIVISSFLFIITFLYLRLRLHCIDTHNVTTQIHINLS
jgi:hypothetical protein